MGRQKFFDREINYIPDNEFMGKDSLSYQLFNADMIELSDTACVRINVGELGIKELSSLSFAITNQYVDRGS